MMLPLAAQEKLKDKLGVVSTKAQLLVQLGRVAEAEALYRQLLSLNPDDYSVHEGLHRCPAAAGAGGCCVGLGVVGQCWLWGSGTRSCRSVSEGQHRSQQQRRGSRAP